MSKEPEERLKAALWFSVGKIVDDICIPEGTNATQQFIGALTEVVWTQIDNLATDLENFSVHAKRSTITTDDVLLLTRKNPDLRGLLKTFIDRKKAENERSKARGGGGLKKQ